MSLPYCCMPVHLILLLPSYGMFRKKKKSEAKDSVQSKSDYEKLTGSGAIACKGMFNVYQKKSDYYFEVPARLLGRDMLVVNKFSVFLPN